MVRKLRIRKNTNGVTTQQYCKYRNIPIGTAPCVDCKGHIAIKKSPRSPLFDIVLCDYPVYRYRSADTGLFISKAQAATMDPKTWIREKI